MSWRTTLTLLLLVGAIATGWSVWNHRDRGGIGPGSSGRSDYVLHDFELVALDDAGKESFTLRAPRMARNPGDRTLSLATPLFLLPDGERHYWQVRANTGWIAADGNELRLRGNVRIASPAQDPDKILMKTAQLNVYPDRDVAATPAVVTITQPGSILRGRGLETNLVSKRYELKSEVHTRYVP